HGGKINTELGRNPARNRRRSHPRFFGFLDCRRWLFRFSLFFCLRRRRFFLLLLFRFQLFFFWLLRLVRLLFLFFFFRFFLLLFFRRFLGFPTDKRDFISDIYLAAFFDIDLGQPSVFGRFPFHCRLVRLNLREHFAGRNLVALFFPPRDEGALRHRVAQFGHLNFRHDGLVEELKR